MNKETAIKLLNNIEIEMKNTGGVSFQTSHVLEKTFASMGKDYLDYLYMDNGKLIFNSRRFKRNFIDNNQSTDSEDNANEIFKDLEKSKTEKTEHDERMKQLNNEASKLVAENNKFNEFIKQSNDNINELNKLNTAILNKQSN